MTCDAAALKARIALLEHQAELLRSEVQFVTARHQKVVYSASWRLAAPFRAGEWIAVTLVRAARYNWRRLRASLRQPAPAPPVAAPAEEAALAPVERVAARLARRLAAARS